MSTAPVAPTAPTAPTGFVPVDRRLWGMDRRALLPAALVAAFTAICFWVLPAVNGAVVVDDRIRAGDVVQVGKDVTFTPAVGWTLTAGLRTGATGGVSYPDQAQVNKGAVAFSVTTGPFDGTPRALLAQIRRNNDKLPPSSALRIIGQPTTFTTTTGERGVLTRFSSGQTVGFLAALVLGGTGVETVAAGPDTVDDTTSREIVAMFESIQPRTDQDGGS